MRRIRVAVDIDAPVATVWDVVERIERHVEWMHDAAAIHFSSQQTRGAGTTFVCDTKVGPLTLHDRMEITEWTPPRAMGVRHTGAVSGTGRFTLDPIDRDRRTRFTWTEDLRFPWWLGGPLGELIGGAGVMRAIWRRNLAALARQFDQPTA